MKFYKIVNPKGHKGLVYQEGINTDPLPFNPSGSCEAGGIYFSREDILAFLHYGTELYEVEPIGEIYEEPQEDPTDDPIKWKAHEVNLTYIGKVKDNIQYLIEQGADINVCYGAPLWWAAEHGNLKIVKYLVEQGADIHAGNDYSLRWAVEHDHLEVVKYLVEQGADIHVDKDFALRWAALRGHLDLVKYLVERGADIHAKDDYALHWAVGNGYSEIVDYLKSKM